MVGQMGRVTYKGNEAKSNKDTWPITRIFESQDQHNANGGLPAKITQISPILQAWFLYSVNIYKYDI